MHRRADIDGLRGVAVLCVLCFHFGALLGHVPGTDNPFLAGFLGVDMFFVISGALITGLLVREWERSTTLKLRSFYRRRVRRLLPALLVVLSLHGLYWVASGHDPGSELRADAWIVPDLANFGKLQGDLHQGTGHTWSLAIEEQFYLVWPPLLLLSLRQGGLRAARRLAVVLIAASLLVTAVRWEQHHDWNEGYLETWGRVQELLIGGLVGLSAGRFRPKAWHRVGATVVLAGLLTVTRATDAWLYLGGMAAVSALVAVLVAPPARPGWGAALLSSPPLVWCGRVSYSLYLYSVPVEFVVLDQVPLSWGASARVGFSLLGTFALSYASYRYVELPLQVGSLGTAPRWYVAGRSFAPVIVVGTSAVAAAGLMHVDQRVAALSVVVGAVLVALVLTATSAVRPAARPVLSR